MTLGISLRSGSGNDSAAKLDAIGRSQALIEFKPDGTIITANENFLGAVGYSLEEIAGKHHSMFVDTDYAKSSEYTAFWASLARGEFQAGEFKRFGKSGNEIWIQASYNPVFNRAGKTVKVIKSATDITEAKRASADAAGQLDAINKSQAVIHFELDGTIIDANDNFLGAVGYGLAEIKGKHHSMFVEPDYGRSAEYAVFWDDLRGRPVPGGRIPALRKG